MRDYGQLEGGLVEGEAVFISPDFLRSLSLAPTLPPDPPCLSLPPSIHSSLHPSLPPPIPRPFQPDPLPGSALRRRLPASPDSVTPIFSASGREKVVLGLHGRVEGSIR
jgi:hypothetical protein